MKHILKFLFVGATAILLNASCSDSDFNDRYPDPSKTENGTVDKFMTGMFEAGNVYAMPWYWRYFTYEIPKIGRYTQIMGWIKGDGMYLPNDSYTGDRWRSFYKMTTQYREMESLYKKLSPEDQIDNDVFMNVSRIYLYDHMQQIIDSWGDIPFTKAGTLPQTINIEVSKAPYDKAEDLYLMMLEDLKNINDYLIKANLTGIASAKLSAQDYINGGKVIKWRKYCNSLRLRMAVRVADHGSLAATAQTVIREILADPNTYPLVDDNNENILIVNQGNKLTAIQEQHENGIQGGFESSAGRYNRASKAMIDALNGDPRLYVIYEKNIEGNYVGLDPEMVESAQQNLFDKKMISPIDSTTFSRNDKFPGILFTASEIDFLKAEAALKYGAGGDPKASFTDAVTKSIQFYYYLNSIGDYKEKVAAPWASDVSTFIEDKWNSYTDKEVAILSQKWLHFGPLQMVQAWADMKRTDLPKFNYPTDPNSVASPNPANRFKYPLSEKINNALNYESVKSQDNYTGKQFWQK